MEKVIDKSEDKKYFTQVCNLIDELDLSPLAIALYLHYKRWSNASSKAADGIKFLMKKYKVADRAIKKAKEELVKNRLIKIKKFDSKLGKPDEITILDIWERNFKYFQELREQPLVNERQVDNPSLYNDSPLVNERQPPRYITTAPSLINDAIEINIKEKEKDTHKEAVRDFLSFPQGGAKTPHDAVRTGDKYEIAALNILQEKRMDSPLSMPEWGPVIAYTESLSKNPLHFKQCIESIELWATGRITPKMVADHFGKFLNDIEKGGNAVSSGCDICTNHTDRSKLNVKEAGWIWTPNGVAYCICNPKHQNNKKGATNGTTH